MGHLSLGKGALIRNERDIGWKKMDTDQILKGHLSEVKGALIWSENE